MIPKQTSEFLEQIRRQKSPWQYCKDIGLLTIAKETKRIQEQITIQPVSASLNAIFNAVIKGAKNRYNVSKRDITGNDRTANIANARAVSMFIVCEMANHATQAKVATLFHKSRCSLTLMRQRTSDRIFVDEGLREEVMQIAALVKIALERRSND